MSTAKAPATAPLRAHGSDPSFRADGQQDTEPGLSPAAAAGEPPGPQIQAVQRVAALLDVLLVRRGAATLAELAKLTGIPRATTYRFMRTLESTGYVEKSREGYILGFKCLLLGGAVKGELRLSSAALPALRALRDTTGETVQLAVLQDWQIVYIERVLSPRAVAYMRAHVGSVLPAYCTGLGKALLAYENPTQVEAWATTFRFERHTPTTITSAGELLRELDEIRARGYAFDREEREVGVRCIAAPIRDHSGAVIAAVSVAAPTERLPAELEGSDVALKVLACANAISERMGFRQ
jgi:DNA-binding IclR family transcriptional regulator